MLLGLDLATRIGFSHGRGDVLPVVGSHKLSAVPNEIGAFLCEFEGWLARILTEVEPQVVVFEAPAPGPHNQLITLRKTLGLAGVTEMVCHRRHILVREAAPATVKKALTGSGRAKKPDMIDAARRWGVETKFHDEADAFGVWMAGISRLYPEHAARWSSIQRKAA